MKILRDLMTAAQAIPIFVRQHIAWPLLAFAAAFLLAQPCAATPGGWDFTNNLNVGHENHTATLLPNGQVLVAAGGSSYDDSMVTAELYDPATGVWSFTGSLIGRRKSHSATLLPSGMVLVAGGYDTSFGGGYLATAELYDPASGTWSTTSSMHGARTDHTATLLNNGKVLVAGGSIGGALASAELYDPATGTWSKTGTMHAARFTFTATLLPSGNVLVAGGSDGLAVSGAELYDPATGKWTPTGNLTNARYSHSATLLQDGKVLVAGGGDGAGGFYTSAELYDPASGTWTVTGSLHELRATHGANLLQNGMVLVEGGGLSISSAELYDPATGAWSTTGSLNQARAHHTATLLPNGTVLAAGGESTDVFALDSAELYGSPTDLPSHVVGRGALDNEGNEIPFKFRVAQDDDDNLGDFQFCDHTEGFCKKVGRVQSLTITGNSAEFSGLYQKGDSFVTFNVSLTDNSGKGELDTMSISLSDGYSVSGNLSSGNVLIY
jgi:hypothetical protein